MSPSPLLVVLGLNPCRSCQEIDCCEDFLHTASFGAQLPTMRSALHMEPSTHARISSTGCDQRQRTERCCAYALRRWLQSIGVCALCTRHTWCKQPGKNHMTHPCPIATIAAPGGHSLRACRVNLLYAAAAQATTAFRRRCAPALGTPIRVRIASTELSAVGWTCGVHCMRPREFQYRWITRHNIQTDVVRDLISARTGRELDHVLVRPVTDA